MILDLLIMHIYELCDYPLLSYLYFTLSVYMYVVFHDVLCNYTPALYCPADFHFCRRLCALYDLLQRSTSVILGLLGKQPRNELLKQYVHVCMPYPRVVIIHDVFLTYCAYNESTARIIITDHAQIIQPRVR